MTAEVPKGIAGAPFERVVRIALMSFGGTRNQLVNEEQTRIAAKELARVGELLVVPTNEGDVLALPKYFKAQQFDRPHVLRKLVLEARYAERPFAIEWFATWVSFADGLTLLGFDRTDGVHFGAKGGSPVFVLAMALLEPTETSTLQLSVYGEGEPSVNRDVADRIGKAIITFGGSETTIRMPDQPQAAAREQGSGTSRSGPTPRAGKPRGKAADAPSPQRQRRKTKEAEASPAPKRTPKKKGGAQRKKGKTSSEGTLPVLRERATALLTRFGRAAQAAAQNVLGGMSSLQEPSSRPRLSKAKQYSAPRKAPAKKGTSKRKK